MPTGIAGSHRRIHPSMTVRDQAWDLLGGGFANEPLLAEVLRYRPHGASRMEALRG